MSAVIEYAFPMNLTGGRGPRHAFCWNIYRHFSQLTRCTSTLLLLCLIVSAGAATTNLVVNGSFESQLRNPGRPDHWVTAGNAAVKQRLALDRGPDGQAAARLECTEFGGDGPDAHVMVCQVGEVAVGRGQWYRLSFMAKARDIKDGSVDVGLSDTSRWENAGLSEAFTPGDTWSRFDFLFRARADLAGANSRLQFWFKSTGTLWLADVKLIESAESQQWFPQIATEGVKNFIPNSSFECGAANWGSFTYGLGGWSGNLYRLEGEIDDAEAHHGGSSLRISLSAPTLPVFYFDYYEPVRQPVRRVFVANQGWFLVKPGQPLTLSAWLKADAEGITAQLAANEAPSHLLRKPVTVGRQWQRHEFTFTPTQRYVFIAVGLDLEASKRDAATLWVDAIQLERGEHATAFEPRQPIESFIETAGTRTTSGGGADHGPLGNIFTNVQDGIWLVLRGFNNTDKPATVGGELAITDFFDRRMLISRPTLKVPSHSAGTVRLPGFAQNRQGFFRTDWSPLGQSTGLASTQSVRCAVIEPAPAGLGDSPLGFNHAYPWDFLVRLARQAGIVWWRDWSAKWQTVEPRQGQWDFSIPDTQIERVLNLDSQVEVLLPFPSANWSTSARESDVEKAAHGDQHLRTRLPVSYAPKQLDDFGRYAAEVARHYRKLRPRPVTHIQILNEPVYTDYALPRSFGYSLTNYLELLGVAARGLRAADPDCVVVGGISANLRAALTREFVTSGGLGLVDVFDLHMYDAARPAEAFEESFASLEQLMRTNGGPKPVWITEWGCYADDDPACLPPSVGDETMNRCRWPSERAATEHIVKFTAVSFAHGVRKIFFHAGTCGAINGPDEGGVLFEYGGTPRKMYAGVAALSRLLGVPERFEQSVNNSALHADLFCCHGRFVAVAWCASGHTRKITAPEAVRVYDVMGNQTGTGEFGESPVYVVGTTAKDVVNALKTAD